MHIRASWQRRQHGTNIASISASVSYQTRLDNYEKVFITGIAGFLGSHLARRMNALGWEVIGNDNLSGADFENVPDNVTFHKVDCCDLERMKAALDGVDLLFHAAATAHEGLSYSAPHTSQETTSTPLFQLLRQLSHLA